MGETDVHVGMLCCFALFVYLTLLVSFFLPSHLSFVYTYMYLQVQGVKMPMIKLQSSDGEVFDVDVEIAKASNTIKTMIEGTVLRDVSE